MALPKSLQPPKKSQLANAASGAGGTGGTAPPVDPYTAQAMAEIQPIIDQLSAQANQQATSSSTAIQGLTDSYAKQLASLNIGAPYQNAESGQAAVDAALQQSLTGSGTKLASGLSSELAALKGSSGEGALNSAASQLASLGASGGTSRLASGSASLGNLIADAAAAETYGKKLPGIADLAGLQGVKQAEGNAQQTIAKGTTALLSQLPGVEQQLRSDKLAQQSLKATKAYRSAELGLSSWKARVSAAQGQARIGIAQQNANTSASRAAQTAFNENRSYGLSLSRLGIEGKRLQLETIKQQGLLHSGGLSPSEVSRYKSVAFGMATQAFHSQDKTTGKPVSYQEALSTITEKGVPLSIAVKALSGAGFKAGVRGAPQQALGAGSVVASALAAGRLAGKLMGNGKTRGGAGYAGGARGVVGAIGGSAAKATDAGGFLAKGTGFSYDRHDQGRDIQTVPGAPILAPGDGYVVRIASDPGGGGGHFGPSYPIVHFTSGPYAGRNVYIGHTRAVVRPGQRFKAGTVLSRTQQSGPWNGGAPSGWAEIGFAPDGTPGAVGQPAPF